MPTNEIDKCPFCNDDPAWKDDGKYACIRVDPEEKELIFDNSDGLTMYGRIPAKFCPWCGRKL